MTCDFDVVIVGGGPTGLSAGIQLARNGIRTLICEKQSFPVDKACGEGVMPTGVSRMRELGLLEHLSEANSHAFRGIRYIDQRGNTATGHFNKETGLGVRRTELSRALLAVANQTRGLEVRSNLPIVDIEHGDRKIWVCTKSTKVSARLLVGADGIRSRVRHWANLEGKSSALRRWGANQHFAIAPWSHYVEVHCQPGVEAYVTPCGNNQIGVAFLWDRNQYRPLASGKNLVAGLLAQFPELIERLPLSSSIGEPQAIGPLHRRVKSPVADHIVLIGDAAGYLDPITGEGISLGLSSAKLLCDFATTRFQQSKTHRGNSFSSVALKPLERALKKNSRSYYLTTHLVLMLTRYPKLVERVIIEFQKHPGLFDHLLAVNMGQTPILAYRPHRMLQIAGWLLVEKYRSPNTMRPR